MAGRSLRVAAKSQFFLDVAPSTDDLTVYGAVLRAARSKFYRGIFERVPPMFQRSD